MPDGILTPVYTYTPTDLGVFLYFVGMVLSIVILLILPVLLHSTYENGNYYIPGVLVMYAGVFVSSLIGVVPELRSSIPGLPATVFLWGFGVGFLLLIAGLILSYRNYSCFLKEYSKYATSRY